MAWCGEDAIYGVNTDNLAFRVRRIALSLVLAVLLAPPARAQFSDCTAAQNGWSECIIDGSDNIDSCGGGSGADGVNLADIDGDGDLDAMTGWEEDGRGRPVLC